MGFAHNRRESSVVSQTSEFARLPRGRTAQPRVATLWSRTLGQRSGAKTYPERAGLSRSGRPVPSLGRVAGSEAWRRPGRGNVTGGGFRAFRKASRPGHPVEQHDNLRPFKTIGFCLVAAPGKPCLKGFHTGQTPDPKRGAGAWVVLSKEHVRPMACQSEINILTALGRGSQLRSPEAHRRSVRTL